MSVVHQRFERTMAQVLAQPSAIASVQEIGRVCAVTEGVVEIDGLAGLVSDELIEIDGGGAALAANLRQSRVGAILLSEGDGLNTGLAARRTYSQADTPVGEALLGRIVDPLGQPLDGRGPIRATRRRPIERPAPPIITRDPVRRPLATGIKAIDAAIPIGRGQRELILGDRQTGKTSVAIDTIINQSKDVPCVYCAIGQRQSAVANVIAALAAGDALARTIIVVASGDDPPGMRFIAPFAATSMAESFMEDGRDALIVYDDLTRHARAYRELSLLLGRPPGREAYPGDIFYLHARLLERATQLRASHGGGSLTALPIIETQAQNLSAYIPTNLISITDGQIYLSPDLFEKGQLPAIDIRRSVSRVGGKAQPAVFRSVVGDLKLSYAQFEELEAFSRFGARLDEETKRRLERGRRVREVLKQSEHDPHGPGEQVAVLLAATTGLLDAVPLASIASAATAVRNWVKGETSIAQDLLGANAAVAEADRAKIEAALTSVLERFQEPADGDA